MQEGFGTFDIGFNATFVTAASPAALVLVAGAAGLGVLRRRVRPVA